MPQNANDTFDFSTLGSISQQAAERAKAIPAEETSFIDTLNQLSAEQANLRTSTMVGKTAADQKAATYMTQNQAVQTKILKANANPFHDIAAFFTGEESTGDLFAEQQKVSYNVTTLANSYQAFAANNEYKQQTLQASIDKLKTIESVRSGNTAEIASLLNTYKGAQLNQNAIIMDDLDKYTLDELAGHVKKNESGYEDGLVELAYWNRMSIQAKQRELTGQGGAKALSNAEWLTMYSPSVAGNTALIAVAEEGGKEMRDSKGRLIPNDVLNINGRMIPKGDIVRWNEDTRAPIDSFMQSSAFFAGKQVEAYSTIRQLENLLPAALGESGANIASALRIPMGEMTEAQQAGVLANVQNGLMELPVPLQKEAARLTHLRLQYTRSQKDETAFGVTKRANLETAMVDSATKLRDNLGKIITDKYAGNEHATNGAVEYIATGKIDNSTSAAAIIHSQTAAGTGMAMDAAALDTYYEGSISLIGASLDAQRREMYEQERRADPQGAGQLDFMMWLNQKTKAAPPDEYMMKKAIEANAVAITQNAFGKISNIHLAGAVRNMAAKWKDIPEVANVLIQMQDGQQLVGALANSEIETPKEIMTMLTTLQTQLVAKKILEPDVNLAEEFKLAALDPELSRQAVAVLQPTNELTSSVDTLLFRGRMELMYRRNLVANFSAATVKNITAKEQEVTAEDKRVTDAMTHLKNKSVFSID